MNRVVFAGGGRRAGAWVLTDRFGSPVATRIWLGSTVSLVSEETDRDCMFLTRGRRPRRMLTPSIAELIMVGETRRRRLLQPSRVKRPLGAGWIKKMAVAQPGKEGQYCGGGVRGKSDTPLGISRLRIFDID